jgi:putative transposase
VNKTIIKALMAVALAAVLILPVGCTQEVRSTRKQSEAVSPSPSTTATTAPTTEPRVWNPKTIAEAEQITGYDIYTPSYIPAGFVPGSSIMIGTIGFGENSHKTVTHKWWLPDDHKTYFSLIQNPGYFEIGGGEPAEVNGKPGQRAFLQDPKEPDVPAELTLAWEQEGAFCISGRLPLLGAVEDHSMTLNAAGKMVTDTWNEIPVFYPGSGVDAVTIMPNHVHGIVVVGAEPRLCPSSQPLAREQGNEGQSRGIAPTRPLSLTGVVQRFKTLTARRYADGVSTLGWPLFQGRLWQRNYYERVIRNDRELNAVREYIQANPANWGQDEEFVG